MNAILNTIDWLKRSHWVGLSLTTTAALAILWGTMANTNPIPQVVMGQDKLEHVAAFCLFGGLFGLSMPRRFWLVAIAVGLVFAVGVEYGQLQFVMTRQFSWVDAACSAFGSTSGVIGSLILRHLIDRYDLLNLRK